MGNNNSLQQSKPMVLTLLKTFTFILVLTAIAILYVLASTLAKHARTQLQYDLELVGGMIQEVIEREETNLGNAANVLARDFGFRSAVATDDSPTIQSVLENHSLRVEADLALLMALDGRLIASNQGDDNQPASFTYPDLLQQSIAGNSSSGFIVWNDSLYLATLIPVRAPTPIGVTLFGLKVDNEFLNPLNNMTGLQIRLDVMNKIGTDDVQNSLTISTTQTREACTRPKDLTSIATMSVADKSACIADEFLLVEQPHIQVKVTVFDRLENVFSDFYQLQLSILVTIFIALALSILLTAISARRITAPLNVLVQKSKVASAGEYSTLTLSATSPKEVNQLGQSFNEMIDAIKTRESEIRYRAEHDSLSKCFNRWKIKQIFEHKLVSEQAFSAVAFNIVGLRSINDTFGFQYGDAVISTISERIMAEGGDTARMDGGIFLWLSHKKCHNQQLLEIQEELQKPVIFQQTRIPVRCSLAHLRCPDDANDFNTLVQRVSIVLDEARSSDSSLLLFHPSFEETYQRRLQIVSELKGALKQPDEQFKMVYQPKYNNAAQCISGAEALIRWINPNLGFVPPDEFIEIAEQAGLIGEITQWVLRTVARDCATLKANGVTISVAINLSTRDLNNDALFDTIQSLHKSFSLTIGELSFEVTESDLVTNPELAVANLKKLRDAGIDVAMDDFGTGYSSLSYLKTLPINILKIDKSFVLKLADDEEDQNIVKTTLLLAESLGLKTVAEGVEDQASLTMLSQWGCTWCQGYFISKPMDLQTFIGWFEKHETTVY